MSQRKTAEMKSEALQDYAAKRDFRRTSEPAPEIGPEAATALQFVVQKHDATRLHFDLRLELDGVLKSWAVTKGPSMKAGVRRLAVQTEDHPMAYKEWEGVIPKGEYGGGTMIVWDRGTWKPEGDAQQGLKEGKLTFTLDGERLKGEWTLVRIKDKGTRNNWLLIKRWDNHALVGDKSEPVENIMQSALSGKTNEDLAIAAEPRMEGNQKLARHVAVKTADLLKLPGARKGVLPSFIEPSLALSVATPPRGADWLHEIKYDGYRIEARIENGKVKLLTRKSLDWTKRFPSIVKALEALAIKAAILDGEIIVQDEVGHSTFGGLQADLKAGRFDRMVYYAFDLLHCNGVNLRSVALRKRKEVLSTVISASPEQFALRFSDHLDESGENILVHACRLGLEGIVSKQAESPYVSGRGEHWVKSKCMLRQEFVIIGYLPSNERKGAIGSLVLAYHDGGQLVYAGRAGTGYSDEESSSLFNSLVPLKTTKPKFRNTVTRLAARDVVWVKPHFVAEIEYRGRTEEGLVRQASYVGLREDKPQSEVVLEQKLNFIPQHPPALVEADFQLTHPDRILWDDAGITKQALADYYAAIADWIMPHVQGRILSLLRCPDGAGKQCFFAKHAWIGLHKSIKLVDAGDEKPMMMVTDIEGIMALVQMNVLEMHVWGSTAEKLETPDRLIFDLDPGDGVKLNDIQAAAIELWERLNGMKLKSFLKTSGGKGLHVVVPVAPQVDWEQVKEFCKEVARQMVMDSPLRYLASMSKSRRSGRIFIDYLRNSRGATAVAPYSTRARAGAPVAVPIDWSELPSIPGANHFTTATVMGRLSRLGAADPWNDMLKLRQELPAQK